MNSESSIAKHFGKIELLMVRWVRSWRLLDCL